MFTLEQPNNPLHALVTSAGKAYVQQNMQERQQQKRQQAVEGIFSQLTEDSSPLEWYKAINTTKGLSDEDKQGLFNVAKQVSTSSINQQKVDNAVRQKLEKGAVDEESIGIIRDQFGDKIADLWKAGTTGGRTELFKQILDAQARGKDVSEALSGVQVNETSKPEDVDAAAKSALTGKFVFPKKNPFAELKTNEVPKYRKELRKENVPIFNVANDEYQGLDSEKRSLGILDKINKSGNLPEGLGRVIINPQTGQPYGIAQLTGRVNADTQRWIKTINDFTTQAKDTFGSRVTNFDLQQFLARLPGLLNTSEGRTGIISQMQLVNQIRALKKKALVDTYQHYGADRITPEDAQAVAATMFQDEISSLEDELLGLNSEVDQLFDQSLSQEENQFPDAASNRGRTIVDDETGKSYQSDGKSWRPV